MAHRIWRQFRPAIRREPGVQQLFSVARAELSTILDQQYGKDWRRIGPEQLEHTLLRLTERLPSYGTHEQRTMLLVRLLLRTPGAAKAQSQMDAHPHGYHNKHARLYELIDFNDAFVAAVLALDDGQLHGFAEALAREMSWFCKRLRLPMFSDRQLEAIVRGLAREIAVYRGAIEEGFLAEMTSRTQDALGVDMVITDPISRRSINIDCKTPSAYRYRLEDLIREGRLSNAVAQRAEAEDYCVIENGHDRERVRVVLLCVRPERYGEIVDFRFQDSAALGAGLRAIMSREGVTTGDKIF